MPKAFCNGHVVAAAERVEEEGAISASLPSKADVHLAIERIKGELLQVIHAAERSSI
jgi:hypothetical protein